MKSKKLSWAALAAIVPGLFVAACGGGGSSGPNTAEGLWSGAASSGYQVDLVVLENGDTWGVYSSGTTLYGALQGRAVGSGASLSGSGSDFNFVTNSVTSATIGGTVDPKASLAFTTSAGVSGTLAYDASYDTPASLATVAGDYTIYGRTGAYIIPSQTVTISPAGTFAFVDGGCSVQGSLAPSGNGKNIFSLSVQFTGACVFPSGSTVTGVTFINTTASPDRVLSLGLLPDQSDGLILLGQRLS